MFSGYNGMKLGIDFRNARKIKKKNVETKKHANVQTMDQK